MNNATRRFTVADFKTMSEDQVLEFWRERQRANRSLGRDHYTDLVDVLTGETVATIDEHANA